MGRDLPTRIVVPMSFSDDKSRSFAEHRGWSRVRSFRGLSIPWLLRSRASSAWPCHGQTNWVPKVGGDDSVDYIVKLGEDGKGSGCQVFLAPIVPLRALGAQAEQENHLDEQLLEISGPGYVEWC